ncbi:FAR1-related sequence 1 [Striga asiatica]|uniref:FAR1-related sequence 1 n=1 Tax=Striga asiatica TaxID=4170 RepID=A0A5A7QCF0_STRAF|nr:FAR1-related sequence 1 [Striga asiatica]
MEGGENEPLLEINPSSPIIPNQDHETKSSAIVMVGGENIGAPRAGMEFKDINSVFDFYKKYAYSVGFPVRKRNSRKDDDGILRYVTFTCSHEGKRMSGTRGSLRSQPTTQTDCKARISASLDDHVLIRNDVSRLPDQYILHRWRKDVRRPYTRIALKYDGLRNSPGQLRYDNLCTVFAKVADLDEDNEVRAGMIMEWIQLQAQELSMLKHIDERSICNDPASFKTPCSIGVGDPKLTKRKGATRKVRKKSPLELTSNKKKKKNEAPSINRGKGLTKELIKQTNEPKMLALDTGVEFEVQNQSSMELNSRVIQSYVFFFLGNNVIQYCNQYSPYQMGNGSV